MKIIDNTMVCLEKKQKSVGKLLQTKRWLSNLEDYKSNLQKLVGFIDTKKKQLEDNIEENINISFWLQL